MKITISQPRYLPALGYLQRISHVDLFVVYDTVQRQSRAWENRNKMLIPNPEWLTIPIVSSSREILYKTQMGDPDWVDEHEKKIKNYYQNCAFYDKKLLDIYYGTFREEYRTNNRNFTTTAINAIANVFSELSIPFNYLYSSNLVLDESAYAIGPEKLAAIAEKCGASVYLSGENGRIYGVSDAFKGIKCKVEYHKYSNKPYEQIHNKNNFIANLGFFDPLFSIGRDRFCEQVNEFPLLLD
jgi:hypothetical protein